MGFKRKHPLLQDIDRGNFVLGMQSDADVFPKDINDALATPDLKQGVATLDKTGQSFIHHLIECDGLNFAKTSGVTLPALQHFQSLNYLNLNSAAVTFDQMPSLPKLNRLHGWNNVSADLGCFANLSELEVLELDETPLSGQLNLADLPKLKTFSAFGLTAEQIRALGRSDTLERLILPYCLAPDAVDLNRYPNLVELDLCWSGDIDLTQLGPLGNLERLGVSGTRPTGLHCLSSCERLERLGLDDCDLDGFARVTLPSTLQVLFLMRSNVGALGNLSTLQDLRAFWGVDAQIDSLVPLVGLKALIAVGVSASQQLEGIDALTEQGVRVDRDPPVNGFRRGPYNREMWGPL
ncbi:MAG: hypothetical protein ACPG5U_02190 [Planktomarina sp.]